ncbi:hypothetical protein IU487_33710 [Nocardia puris]|uniref:hypothetical protein n=1 Tax=Nocardia puris TaxID=208602 RepID=UPI0018963B95|nr:hypothetical protein [Nocardia puris]MBF6215958.1 hypothetical protein [Nocardia puris]
MDEPKLSPRQDRLLRSIHGIGISLGEHHPGDGSGDSLREVVELAQASRILEDVAGQIGVPRRWIAYARTSGERGAIWRPDLLLGPAMDRAEVLDRLTVQVHRLQDNTAVAAEYARRHRLPAVDPDVGQTLGLAWQRVGALSAAVALHRTERTRIWERARTPWPPAAAAAAAAMSNTELSARHQGLADTPITEDGMAVAVLRRLGIGHDEITAHMPVTTEDMIALTTRELTTTITAHGIDTAVHATPPLDTPGIGFDPAPEPEPDPDVDAGPHL